MSSATDLAAQASSLTGTRQSLTHSRKLDGSIFLPHIAALTFCADLVSMWSWAGMEAESPTSSLVGKALSEATKTSSRIAAIRFVLSDQYTMLTREERQRLLHEQRTSTHTTLSAFVEIVFDSQFGHSCEPTSS